MLEDWQREILDAQLARERLYASETQISEMSPLDAICASSYRSKHTRDEMARRIRWLVKSYDTPNLPLSAVK